MNAVAINPALLAALDHFASHRYDWNQPHQYVHTDEKGRQSSWPVERVCTLAHSILDQEGLSYLKLKTLQAGMSHYNMHALYNKIMREDLPRT